MTVWAAGVGISGDSFPESAGPILAYQHLTVLSLNKQKPLSALRTSVAGQIVMPKSPFPLFDLIDQFRRIMADVLHKSFS